VRVTTKGQVTIPQHIREKSGIVPATDIEFVEEKDRVYILKKKGPGNRNNIFRKLRGIATIRMTTDEILALTRDH
jgi:AbrB family looped-hinge helix DNA binding protein